MNVFGRIKVESSGVFAVVTIERGGRVFSCLEVDPGKSAAVLQAFQHLLGTWIRQ